MANVEVTASGGVASFRKSVYDDNGQTPTLNSIQVLQKNFNTYSGTQPPVWLTWTTSTESTNEGTNNNRVYLHIDFEVDTQHANVEDGSIYQIEIDVSNSTGNEIITFNYTNGIIDLDAIPGYKAHVSWQKVEEDGAADGDSITSIQDWADPTQTWTAVQNNLTFNNTDHRFDNNNGSDGILESNKKIFSTSDGSKPYTVFVVSGSGFGPYVNIRQGSTGTGEILIENTARRINYERYDPNSSDTLSITTGQIGGDENIHVTQRRTNMDVYGEIRRASNVFSSSTMGSDNSTWFFEDAFTRFLVSSNNWVREVIIFEAELTNTQIRDIAKWIAAYYEETYYIEA